MRSDRTDPDGEGELRNKDETEVPIGEPRDPESQRYSHWRCEDCGEMGELTDELPAECPSCGSPREALYYWEED